MPSVSNQFLFRRSFVTLSWNSALKFFICSSRSRTHSPTHPTISPAKYCPSAMPVQCQYVSFHFIQSMVQVYKSSFDLSDLFWNFIEKTFMWIEKKKRIKSIFMPTNIYFWFSCLKSLVFYHLKYCLIHLKKKTKNILRNWRTKKKCISLLFCNFILVKHENLCAFFFSISIFQYYLNISSEFIWRAWEKCIENRLMKNAVRFRTHLGWVWLLAALRWSVRTNAIGWISPLVWRRA